MASFFHTITGENKLSLNKPADSDLVYYAELNEWFTNNAFRSFSIKYVIDHCIYYKADNKEYAVHGGQFLLACKRPDVSAYFDSGNMVRSICIDICPTSVAEAFTVLTARSEHKFDDYLSGYFKPPEFFESVSWVKATRVAGQLQKLVSAIDAGQAESYIDREWFLELTENVVFHEYGNYLALNGIHSVKTATRKEILHRLTIAKNYMDEQYLEIDEISTVARHCAMSEFHFFRSFKQAFGRSPYQYLLAKRLELAKEMILAGDNSLTAIASHCNFPDISTFSKAFKRHFNIAPSQISK